MLPFLDKFSLESVGLGVVCQSIEVNVQPIKGLTLHILVLHSVVNLAVIGPGQVYAN